MGNQTPQPQPNPEDLHADLLATMAASRELGPEMDKALVESYMQRHPELAGMQQQAVTMRRDEPRAPAEYGRYVVPGLLVVAYIVVLVTTGAWWVIFPFLGMTSWMWRGVWYDDRHAARDAARDAAREVKYEAKASARQARYEARAARYRARAAGYGYVPGAERYPQMGAPYATPPTVPAPAPSPAPRPTPAPHAPAPAQTAYAPSTTPSDPTPPLNPAG